MLLAQNFDRFNPLKIESTKLAVFSNSAGTITPGAIISDAVNNYVIPIAGFILFVMIIWGGFEMMTSSVSGKKDAGRQRVQTAIVGFLLLFSTYWLAQLVQAIFNVQFLR